MSGMSGDFSGEIGGSGIPFAMPGKGDACINLEFVTTLASVKDEALEKVVVGEILPVVAQTADGPVVVMKDDEIVGTVLSSRLVLLLDCMNGGTEYEAKVLEKSDAICKVKINAVK